MDPSAIVPEHLEDETYIERLFPKCPPKTASLSKSQLQSSSQRKQNRYKTHSKRELGSRRKKNAANLSSESSEGDTNPTTTTTTTTTASKSRLRHLQCSSRNLEYGSSNVNNNNNNNNNNSSRSMKKSTSSSSQLGSSTSVPRKSGKYVASQNLIQQMQRSQSSYSNGFVAAGSNSPKSSSTQPKPVETMKQAEDSNISKPSGIVKSVSSYTLPPKSLATAAAGPPAPKFAADSQAAYTNDLVDFGSDSRDTDNLDKTGSGRLDPISDRRLPSQDEIGARTSSPPPPPPHETPPELREKSASGSIFASDASHCENITNQTQLFDPQTDTSTYFNPLDATRQLNQTRQTSGTGPEAINNPNAVLSSSSKRLNSSPPTSPTNILHFTNDDNIPTIDTKQTNLKFNPPPIQDLTSLPFGKNVVHHQLASQQLLASDINDNDNTVRNDTSVEELCALDERHDVTTSLIGSPQGADGVNESAHDRGPRDLSKIVELINNTSVGHKPQHQVTFTSPLKTVEEQAEIEAEPELSTPDRFDETHLDKILSTTTTTTTTRHNQVSEKMSTSGAKIVPPGYPQRVRSSQSNLKQSSGSSGGSQVVDDQSIMNIRHANNSNQMPIISEAQCESDPDSRKSPSAVLTEDQIAEQITTDFNSISVSSPTVDTTTTYQSNSSFQKIDPPLNPDQPCNGYLIDTAPLGAQQAQVGRSSSLKFDKLSDNESLPDEFITPTYSVVQKHVTPGSSVKNVACETSTRRQTSVANAKDNNNTNNSNGNNSDDGLPTTKTALIFPRLDEGLSSEAESCGNDDEDDDEDDRAVDADVEADDDDDDEDDDDGDDDMDNDGLALVDRLGNSSSMHQPQTNVDLFMQQATKGRNFAYPASMSTTTSQHQIVPGLAPGHDQSDHHQVRAPTLSSYGSYGLNQGADQMDHNDLKSMSGFQPTTPGQNGQSNYGWHSGYPSQQQQPSLSPSSNLHQQQQYGLRHNATGPNNSSSSKNNSFNRDDAKATSRLSSDTDNETDRLLGTQRNDHLKALVAASSVNNSSSNNIDNPNNSTDLEAVASNLKQQQQQQQQSASSREVLIEGVLFSVKYLGSTHSDSEGRGEKEDRIHQAEMAVHEVKFRNGDNQSSATEVQLFISTEKIMVLDDKHRKIMMDHSLRTISYIADIGDAIVLIVRKKTCSSDAPGELSRSISKVFCHVFESTESHTITKSISQAFQVAYTELLKANGSGDTSTYLPKELDYQEVLNSQEMSTEEIEMFARKENQREVIVPKKAGEILGLSIVESGWGSVLPTVVIANLKPDGPAYRCAKLSIGDQILSVNGVSLVGLPLNQCQEILKGTKKQRVARLSIVPCPITVEVKIKRPDTKYQLGFSVQNGVICSLLRGGIAERGGVRVGHRIMSINGTTVVGVPHEKIVTLLASSVGEIRMKTCLTSLYRLILGEEKAVHF